MEVFETKQHFGVSTAVVTLGTLFYTQLNIVMFFRAIDDFPDLLLYIQTEGRRFVVVVEIAGNFVGFVEDTFGSHSSPILRHAAVYQYTAALSFFKMLVGMHIADKFTAGSDLLDHVHSQIFTVNFNAFYRVFDHIGKFVIHYEFCVVKGHTHFKHSQTVNDIGTCQCSQCGGKGCFMGSLGINKFAVYLPAGNEAGQVVELCQFCYTGIEHSQFGSTHSSASEAHIHHRGGTAVNEGVSLVD